MGLFRKIMKAFLPNPLRKGIHRFIELGRAPLTSEGRTAVFSRAFSSQVWGGSESASGSGSELSATVTIRSVLPQLIENYKIKSVLDAPCGDWNWMRTINLSLESYIGVDIVPELIELNNKNHSSDKIKFIRRDLVKDTLPSAEFIICRDCLVHLSNYDIVCVLNNFVGTGATFLLTNSYPQTSSNENQPTALKYRPLNLRLPPFSFPEPLEIFQDGKPEHKKAICLWRLQDLELPEQPSRRQRIF